MNRTFALAIAVACSAAGHAFADDITVDPNPFVSTATRAQVLEELRAHQASGVNPWADDYDQLAQTRSTLTREQVTAGFLAHRNAVAAFAAEDSGSSYLARMQARKAEARGEVVAAE